MVYLLISFVIVANVIYLFIGGEAFGALVLEAFWLFALIKNRKTISQIEQNA